MNAPLVGVLEWFHVGDREHVERCLSDLRRLGVRHLRTGVSWADWFSPGGRAWIEWLLPRLAREVEVVPCLVYTPPSLGIESRTSSPPRNPKAYADFLDVLLTELGDHFEWVELWNEPNNRSEWDWTLDPQWLTFTRMVGGAAYWARRRGKRVLLGGMSPIDPHWLGLMFERGVMDHVDAVGVHGFPGTWEVAWDGWARQVRRVQEVLDAHRSPARIWISETGYSTWRHDHLGQIASLLEALDTGVDRVYWYALEDLHPDRAAVVGFHLDEREYHFGMRRADGIPKLLYHLWTEGGLPGVADARWLTDPVEVGRDEDAAIITGCAGFIGTNLAHRLLNEGRTVILLDNLHRLGAYENVRWLRSVHGERARIRVADIRDPFATRGLLEHARTVFHLAGQVAVTDSLTHPQYDFAVNVWGTSHLLEALRRQADPPALVFTSTNKVYGSLPDILLRRSGRRYEPLEPRLRQHGVDERRPLDFHTPYGCSKGAADQYVLDYARTYGLPALVFRMSCIYGPHQHGTEDQGWVAHFLLQTLRGQPLTMYGDGRQVRDVLHVDDLVDALLRAERDAPRLRGRAFNVGGGPDRTLSLLELVDRIEDLHGARPQVRFAPARPGDQAYYVSDVRAIADATGWRPRVGVPEGLHDLYAWLARERGRPPAAVATALAGGGR
jgi:CDP-paratose 2-epimerase